MASDIEEKARQLGALGFLERQAALMAEAEKIRREGGPETLPPEPKARLNTPEAVTSYWRSKWAEWGERIGKQFEVPPFPGDAGNLAEIKTWSNRVIYVPPETTTPEGLALLEEIFPEMQSGIVSEGRTIENYWFQGGYVSMADFRTASPRSMIPLLSRREMSLSTYIVGSQDHKSRTGEYFDAEGGEWSFLAGSGDAATKELITGSFEHDGHLTIGFIPSRNRRHFGANLRFEQPVAA